MNVLGKRGKRDTRVALQQLSATSACLILAELPRETASGVSTLVICSTTMTYVPRQTRRCVVVQWLLAPRGSDIRLGVLAVEVSG